LTNLLFGPHPALVELMAITSAYGATNQHFHKDNDCDMTTEHYAQSFADMSSIFIPLQDTTVAMGATNACSGTTKEFCLLALLLKKIRIRLTAFFNSFAFYFFFRLSYLS
jgi:hypothetical protein